MVAINAILGTVGDRSFFKRIVRKWFRMFCYLPSTTSNRVVKWLLGDLDTVFYDVKSNAERQLQVRLEGKLLSEEE